jgi:hypothetical protein
MQRNVFALFASKWLSLSIDPCRIEIKSAEISLSSGHILAINLDVSLFGSRVYAQMSFCTLRGLSIRMKRNVLLVLENIGNYGAEITSLRYPLGG